MNERKLLEALASVKAHFHGAKVTPGTVLAAYLRAAGIPAGGDDWQLAKAAFDAGASFEDSVSYALSRRKRQVESSEAGPRYSASTAAVSPGTGSGPDGSGKTNRLETRSHVPDYPVYPQHAPRMTVEVPPPLASSRREQATFPRVVTRLAWFPKVCGPGDLIGEGAKKLLGQPKLAPVALLVRETAQNSWDARSGPSIDFTINLRLLSKQQHEMLRSQILTGTPQALGLRESLQKDELWVVEVTDRGTKGLGGPVRNDKPVDPLEPTDFIDLLFNVGAPRDVHLGGGTYGFGKTVGYVISGCGTTVIWSRCKTSNGLEDRLIASAIGGGYEDDSYRYTGRHWWGVVPEGEDRVEPAVGQAAHELGTSLFDGGFGAAETGTSILIIDPNLGGENREEDAQRIAEAVLWNLWPKLVPDTHGSRPMTIDVQFNGISIPIPDPLDHPVLGAYASCLQAIRLVQDLGEQPELPFGRLEEVWSHRPRTLLGHLAMTRFAVFGADEESQSEVCPLPNGSHHVCLVRHSAELVVRYDEGAALQQPGYHWAGVFRPVASTDDSFAQSEPPAHDDWVVDSLTDRVQKTQVKVTFTRLRELTRLFTAPISVPIEAQAGEAVSTKGLAEALGPLIAELGGLPEDIHHPKPAPGAGRRRRQLAPTVTIADRRLAASPIDGRVRAEVVLRANHIHARDVGLVADVSAAVEGGEERIDESSLDLTWYLNGQQSSLQVQGPRCAVPSNEDATLVIDFPRDIALNIDIKADLDNVF